MTTTPGMAQQSIPYVQSHSSSAIPAVCSRLHPHCPSRPHTKSLTLEVPPKELPAHRPHLPIISEHTDHTSPHGHLGTPCRRCPCAGGDGTATKEPPAVVPMSPSLSPTPLPANPWPKHWGYLGASTARKTTGDTTTTAMANNGSTLLCYEHRRLIVLVGIRP